VNRKKKRPAPRLSRTLRQVEYDGRGGLLNQSQGRVTLRRRAGSCRESSERQNITQTVLRAVAGSKGGRIIQSNGGRKSAKIRKHTALAGIARKYKRCAHDSHHYNELQKNRTYSTAYLLLTFIFAVKVILWVSLALCAMLSILARHSLASIL